MSEIRANSRITSEKQTLYLDTTKIYGAQNLSVKNKIAAVPLKYVGIGGKKANFYPQGEQLGTVSINGVLLNSDFYRDFVTGNSLLNGYVFQDLSDTSQNYMFLSGAGVSYNLRYSIGGLPEIATDFNIYDNLGQIPISELTAYQSNQVTTIVNASQTEPDIYIANEGSMELSINDFQTNRLQSFEIDLMANKIPVYNMGNRKPSRIDLIKPIEVNCSFVFELGSYQPKKNRSFPTSLQEENLTLTINDYNTNSLITQIYLPNLGLIDESYSTAVDGTAMITCLYNGLLY